MSMHISSTSVQYGNADPASHRHHDPGFAVASARRYKQEAVAILEQFLAAEEVEFVQAGFQALMREIPCT